ncbi:glycosyltransferase family 39 protein [Paractinoplanes rishiriensis]|uniref:glycosyltransferase family 39 protein n=1 Tax=Paractinoplanes rishiriensis TaxID=1050105 RepID=UPI001EF2BE50|nr:glycosyltransferase family 39 protein [Actinoplanes rishiriensis]
MIRVPAPVRAQLCWALPVLTAAFVVAYQAAEPELWRDEFASWSAATRTGPEIFEMGRHIDGVLVPYYLLLHLWIGWFSDSAAAMRVPSIAAMALTAGAVALLGRRLWGNRAGLFGGLLFAVLPVVSRYGQEIRGYALATLFATVATLLLIEALDRARWWLWVAYGLAVALTGLSHLLALLVLAGHLVIVASTRKADWRWLVAVGGGLAVVLPLTVRGLGQHAAQLAWLDRASPAALADLPNAIFEAPVLGGAVPAVAVAALRRGRAFDAGLLWAAVLLPVGLLYAYDQWVAPVFVGRYLLFCVPLLCALAGTALTALRLPLALAVLAALAAIGVPAQERFRDPHSRYAYAAAAEVVLENQRAGDAIVYAPRDGWQLVDVGLEYYLRDREPHDVLLAADQRATRSLWAAECTDALRCLGGTSRVWVVAADNLDPPFRANPTNQLRYEVKAALGEFEQLAVWRVDGFTVALFVRPPRV